MSAEATNTRVMLTLIKREFQEQRVILLYIPLILTAVAMLLFTAIFVEAVVWLNGPAQPPSGLAAFVFAPERLRRGMVSSMYAFPIGFMMISYSVSMLFYYLNTLIAQRRNRSILFWNSLPVSDTQTILSKLLAGLVCCQMIYLLCFVVLALFLVPLTLAYGASVGFDAWTGLIVPARMPSMVGGLVLAAPLNVLWVLPVSAGLLLASGWARQSPFIWATAPVALLILVELVFFQEYGFDGAWPNTTESEVAKTVFVHALPLRMLGPYPFPLPELVLSALLGVILVFAAIRLNRPDEN